MQRKKKGATLTKTMQAKTTSKQTANSKKSIDAVQKRSNNSENPIPTTMTTTTTTATTTTIEETTTTAGKKVAEAIYSTLPKTWGGTNFICR